MDNKIVYQQKLLRQEEQKLTEAIDSLREAVLGVREAERDLGYALARHELALMGVKLDG